MAKPRFPLTKLLTPERLRTLAGAAAYERGVTYAERGQVVACIQEGETLTARVRGTRAYEVRLWVRAGRLQYTCDCPAAAEGACCKHCVAAGWQWQQDNAAHVSP